MWAYLKIVLIVSSYKMIKSSKAVELFGSSLILLLVNGVAQFGRGTAVMMVFKAKLNPCQLASSNDDKMGEDLALQNSKLSGRLCLLQFTSSKIPPQSCQ